MIEFCVNILCIVYIYANRFMCYNILGGDRMATTKAGQRAVNKYIKNNYTVDSTVFIAEDNVVVMTLGDTISVAKYDTVDAYVNA